MSEQNSGQTIQAPDAPRLRLGGAGRLGAFDPAAIAKAEAALKSLSSNFAQWLQDEIAKLEAAHQATRAQGAPPQAIETLYMRAHDLKGLGTTYGFPIVTRIAASLCLLLDDAEKRRRAPAAVVAGHVDAIRTAVRDDIKSEDDPRGASMVQNLEARVAEALAA